jgi:hypothetical protein
MAIGFILYAVAALFLSWAILAFVRAWQRPPYTMKDFWAASERIFVAVAGLTWLLEGTKLALPEDFAQARLSSAKARGEWRSVRI